MSETLHAVPRHGVASRAVAIIAMVLIAVVSMLGIPSPSLATAPPAWSTGRWAEFGNDVQGPLSYSGFTDVSCASPGNCTAVGDFTDAANNNRPFAMTSTNGVWGPATPITLASYMQRTPLIAASFSQVSCASPGNCTAVGRFLNLSTNFEAFTVSSTDGVWGTATRVTFAAGIQSSTPEDNLNAVSCVSPGTCTAGGQFSPASGGMAAFTVSSTNGVWGDAQPVTYPSGATTTPNAYISHVVCQRAGNCVVVGQFRQTVGGYIAFGLSSTNGVWGTAIPFDFSVPDYDNYSFPTGLSCSAVGRCVAVGTYASPNPDRAFIVTMNNGSWSPVTTVAFDAALGATPNSELFAVSCATTTSCAATGAVGTQNGSETYTVEMIDGVWQTANVTDFPAGLRNAQTGDEPMDISCASVGYCTVVGSLYNAAGGTSSFTLDLVDGTWEEARSQSLPAGTQNSDPYQYLVSVSCPTAGNCVSVGNASGTRGTVNDPIYDAFTVASTFTAPAPTTTTTTTTTAPATTSPATTAAPATTTLPPPALATVRALPVASTPLVVDTLISVGAPITVSFGGFTPFEYVQLIVASTPQTIGSGYANAQGVVTISGNLPSGLASGNHTLAVYAPASGIGFSQPISVSAPELPATGSESATTGALLASLVIAVGFALMRRRRPSRR